MAKDEIISAIKSYNSIFQYDELNTNLIVCKKPMFSLKCLSLDVVEIYVYILIQKIKRKSINYNKIQWHYMKVDEKYVFYVFPDKEDWSKIFNAVAPCDYGKDNKYEGILPPDSYVCRVQEIELCASCRKEGSSDAVSYPFEADMLFTINKNERSLENLNFLSQMLCYLDMELTFSFLDGMKAQLGKIKNEEEQEGLLRAIGEFVDGIEDLSREIAAFWEPDCDDGLEKKHLDEFMDTCELTAEIFRLKRQKKRQFVRVNELYSDENLPNVKVKNFFENSRGWSKEKTVKHRSCKSVLLSMGKK